MTRSSGQETHLTAAPAVKRTLANTHVVASCLARKRRLLLLDTPLANMLEPLGTIPSDALQPLAAGLAQRASL